AAAQHCRKTLTRCNGDAARGLLEIFAALEFRFRATRVFVCEGDELPKLLSRRSFEDVYIFVVARDAIIAPLRAVPAVHDRHDFDGAVAEDEPGGTFRALRRRIEFYLHLHRGSSLGAQDFIYNTNFNQSSRMNEEHCGKS